MRSFLPIVLSLCAMLACTRPQPNRSAAQAADAVDTTLYAKGFSISRYADSTVVRVRNPWQGATDVEYAYTLVDSALRRAGDVSRIAVPARRVVCMSSSYVAFLDALGCAGAVVGVSGANYIFSPAVRTRIEQGLAGDVGYGQVLNYELIASLKPDVLLCFGVGAESLPMIDKLHELGVPAMLVGEYLEEHPLGKAEWVKVLGALMGLDARADSLFSSIAQRYQQVAQQVAQQQERPSVFLNMPYKDVWYTPGCESYFVQFIRDAGGRYLFDDLEGSRSYPISFERALGAGLQADVWMCPGSATSLADIAAFDPRLAQVRPYRQGRVFNNNNRATPHGGSDFWESGTVHPDIILRDMAAICHPALFPGHELYYFNQLR